MLLFFKLSFLELRLINFFIPEQNGGPVTIGRLEDQARAILIQIDNAVDLEKSGAPISQDQANVNDHRHNMSDNISNNLCLFS